MKRPGNATITRRSQPQYQEEGKKTRSIHTRPSSSLSIHTATPSLEDYEQAYIVHTGFAGLIQKAYTATRNVILANDTKESMFEVFLVCRGDRTHDL